MLRLSLLALLAGCAATPVRAPAPPAALPPLDPDAAHAAARATAHGAMEGLAARARAPGPLEVAYAEVAAQIADAARADRGAYEKLAYLTDHIGNRLAGSVGLEEAIVWAQKALAADGHENVHAERVLVSHWVRGEEAAEIVSPIRRPLVLLGLGMSPATPRAGVTAPLLVVHDFAELDRLGDAVRGKIVLFDHPMPPFAPTEGPHYDETVKYRSEGPPAAAKLGAVAALVRSVTAHSLRSPHTGATQHPPKHPTVPSAAVSVEDAELLGRLAAEGEVRLHVTLRPKLLPDAPSANVVAELRGRERPDEVVLIGAHLDSWDVGQGAHDDGAGVATVMQALTTLRRLGLTPRRTVRLVLFTDEEITRAGGDAYALEHAGELPQMVAAFESDEGGFAPRGLSVSVDDATRPLMLRRLGELAELLGPIGAGRAFGDGSGTDLVPLRAAGVPTFELVTDRSHYFDYHHTQADTLDKVVPAELALDVAAAATFIYVLADMPDPMPRTPGVPE
jgi:carboxypeptidase Q